MLNFLKPTRFKLIATAVFLVVIWFVPTVNNWFLLNVIFNMYPTLVDSMKEMLTPGLDKFFQEAGINEWREIFIIYSGSRISISVITAYVAACIIAKLAVSKVAALQSNSSLQTDR
jgi:hypothetical protein